jgi:2'-5' RNA ligase
VDKKLYLIAELDNDSQIKFKEFNKVILENGFVGTQTKEIPYHITLCSFLIDDEEYVLKLMEKINGKFNEIDITFSGFGLFGLNVLYLNPCYNKNLMELYYSVNESSLEKNNELAAHATLLIDEPENRINILPKINEKFSAFTGKLVNISLYEFSPLKFIQKINLKK